ncbi:hypothetical protein CVT25_009293 [Psilocybe cyanescens]|uniref:Uncharacterized protein n=1 Tax=Psilocybe cyanescens TaxID=93625 RepID=A0A409X2V2_PSICY|nr:hypothetical protein CVT25_009293 [Psilocybe cyanescens]
MSIIANSSMKVFTLDYSLPGFEALRNSQKIAVPSSTDIDAVATLAAIWKVTNDAEKIMWQAQLNEDNMRKEDQACLDQRATDQPAPSHCTFDL